MSHIGIQTVMLDLGERSYPIYVATGLIHELGQLISEASPSKKYAVVTDDVVNKFHGEALDNSLKNAGIDASFILVPEGEESKNWDQVGELVAKLLDIGMDRRSTILAFGGGVIGDLAGFTASIFMRGVNLIQIPTTLLAQVDSGVGGKTAVNHPRGKNLIGAFKQPLFVSIDPNLLQTLPLSQIRSGLGEVVKYGVIADEELFNYVETNRESILRGQTKNMEHIIEKCVSIKAHYVSRDERDITGVRAALNYGHTVGHALETMSKLQLSHGEAVAKGMIIASRISEKLGLIESSVTERQEKLLEKIGLETALPPVEPTMIIKIMRLDKKAKEGQIRFVLPTGIGTNPVLRKVPEHMIEEVLEAKLG